MGRLKTTINRPFCLPPKLCEIVDELAKVYGNRSLAVRMAIRRHVWVFDTRRPACKETQRRAYSISKELMKRLEELVDAGWFLNVSEALRFFIILEYYLEANGKKPIFEYSKFIGW